MLVFVLHPDLDVLAAIVGRMRDRGLETVHATEAAPLVDRANKGQPAVLVVPERSEGVEDAAELAALRNALPDVPEVLIPSIESNDELAVGKLVDVITTLLAAATPVSSGMHGGSIGEVRGDLAQIPLPDLLQILSMGKKTGTLTVTTSNAAGEIRMAEGEVVDAMFRRADGMKAMVRLLGEREGAFHFAHDSTPALRRIREPMSTILMAGTTQADDVRRLRERLGLLTATPPVLALDGADVAVVIARAIEPLPEPPAHDDFSKPAPDAEPIEADSVRNVSNDVIREVARQLASARTLDDLLDELPQRDLDVLAAIVRLDRVGAIRRLPLGEVRPSLAGPEGMVVLRGLARRLRPRGYRAQGRLVFLGSAASMRLARQAVARLAEAMPGADPSVELSSERLVESTATLQLGESIGLEIVTVVDRPDLAPALPLVLNGAIAVVSLDRVSEACATIIEELEVALVDARSVTDDLDGALDPGDPSMLAAVVRGAIEGMGGT